MDTLPFTRIQGSPSEIGEALGRLAKPALQKYLASSAVWKALQQWRGHARVDKMMAATRATLPDFPDEADLFELLSQDESRTCRHIPDVKTDEETTLATAVVRFTPAEITLQISASGRASMQKHTIPLGRR